MRLMSRISDFTQRSELSRFLCAFRREFWTALSFTALINVLMLTPTLYMLQIFDRVLVSYSHFTLVAVTVMLLLFLGVMSFSEWVRARLLVRLGVRLDMELNPRVFAKAFELKNLGEESARLFGDLTRLRQFLTGKGLIAFLDAPWTPIYIMALFFLHPWLGILAIVFCLVLSGMAWISSLVMQEPLEESARANQRENRYLEGKLRHSAVVESMGMLGDMLRLWLRRHLESLVFGRRGEDAQARVQSMTRFVRFFQQSLSLGAGALLVIHGEISPGAMIAANALTNRATHPIDALMNSWRDILAARTSFLNLEAALEKHSVGESATVVMEGASPGAVLRLVNAQAISVRRAMPILRDISLEISSGMALGIIGPSGSGKSTLARLILGIWPETEGEVYLDGIPVQELDRVSLGSCLGYLPQDVELFAGSIAENIARFGEMDADRIIAASQQADIHDMILRFPEGYDTQIGDGGRFLSGGQRQRVGLARAIYGNPRLVVLDEPNANLDDAGDRALLRAVLALKQNGTTLVLISHRPQILAVMDSVLALEQGRIARLGKPWPAGRKSTGQTGGVFPAPVPT
ncbi:MAG: type I secretion system permease/ATPase [Zoogloeaceae bacterium]|jgi:ATP-binding cassette subfamily C exporter for protease/lipase|nr:type I secretion system permease/ATPase [Zoogloeaceae bacterium]